MHHDFDSPYTILQLDDNELLSSQDIKTLHLELMADPEGDHGDRYRCPPSSNYISTMKEARCSTLSQAAGIANMLTMSPYLPILGPEFFIWTFA